MTRSWKLGTAFGIGIYVHWSFLILPLWVILSSWGTFGPQMIAILLALLVAVFGCVVLHELGHALTARLFGIGTRDITLYPIGGVARLERMSDQPHEELLIALAGPAVNVVIAGVLMFAIVLTGAVFSFQGLLESMPGNFLVTLLASNLLLVLFNMLPAFPMDGGRVLRAVLSMWLGQLRATEIAAHLGAFIAVLLGLSVVLSTVYDLPFFSNPMLILVAGFVFLAGQQELMMVRHRHALRHAEPVEVLPADDPVVYLAPPPPGASFTGAVWDGRSRVWVLWHNGRPIASYGYPSE